MRRRDKFDKKEIYLFGEEKSEKIFADRVRLFSKEEELKKGEYEEKDKM